MDNYTLYNDDCLNVLKNMPDNSVDSCVTDPPYGLSFMGKSWDYDVPSKEIWAEVLRVLKPGAYLLSFGGSRTYHRMAVAIEDAGFEIRDQIQWLYGSGFPKSHDISKSIDKIKGVSRKIIDEKITKSGGMAHIMKTNAQHGYRPNDYYKNTGNVVKITEPATKESKKWEGWGTALKPAHEPIVMARKPLAEKTVAENVLKYGTGAINIDESRVELNGDYKSKPNGRPSQTGLPDNYNTENTNQPDDKGRWPANVIHDGSDDVVERFPNAPGQLANLQNHNKTRESPNGIFGKMSPASDHIKREETNKNASRFFYCAKASKSDRDEGLDEFLAKKVVSFQTGGGASGKPSSISAGRDTEYKNNHPTVKPTQLMKYLIKLVTPKNGTVLDPFMGSGTTGKACGFGKYKFIGIEMNKDYYEIAEARTKHAYQNKTVNLEDFFS